MARGPNDIKLSNKELADVKELEDKIDTIMDNSVLMTSGHIVIKFESLGISSIPQRVKLELIRRYTEAGWGSVVFDQSGEIRFNVG